MKSTQLLGAAVLVFIFISIWLVRRCNSEAELLRVNGMAFSTLYEVKVVAAKFSGEANGSLKNVIEKEVDFVDKAMSRFRKDSEITRFNAFSRTEPFKVSRETALLLLKSRGVSHMTSGAFDVTVGPLVRLWGFYSKKKGRAVLPTDEELEHTRSQVGFMKLEVDEEAGSIQKSIPELEVDLSAVAKGYAVDRIALGIEALGYQDYMVEIGGEVRAKGLNSKGRVWRIGIEKPIPETHELFQIVELSNKSIATSGDYRNYYKMGDKLVSHTVDPRTGRPIDHRLASVSVVHDECSVADALATALTVLGPDNGYNLAMTKGIPALFITRLEDGSLVDRATPGFEKLRISRVNNGP